MKFKIGCAMAVLTCLYFDLSYSRAVKDMFTKDKDAQQIDERPQISNDEQKTSENKVENESQNNITPNTKDKEEITADNSNQTEKQATPEKEKIVGDPIVLKINNKKIFKRSDILAMMKTVPVQLVQGMSADKLFELLKTQAMISYLVQEQAKKAGMDKTKEYLDQLEKVKERLLFEMFVAKEIMPKTQSEATLKARYQKYLVNFKAGDEVKVSYIMLNTEKEAKETLDALSKGTNFEKLQKDKGNGSESIDRYLPLNVFPEDVQKQIPTAKGKVAKDFAKLNDKFVIFRLDDKRAMKPLVFEEAKPMLQQMIMREEMDNMVMRLSKQFKVENFSESGKPIPLSIGSISNSQQSTTK